MDSPCTKTGNEHRLELKDAKQYETEYICLDCGESETHYHNAGC
jgi:hypothetical protein